MQPTKAGYVMLAVSVLLNSVTVAILVWLQLLGR